MNGRGAASILYDRHFDYKASEQKKMWKESRWATSAILTLCDMQNMYLKRNYRINPFTIDDCFGR